MSITITKKGKAVVQKGTSVISSHADREEAIEAAIAHAVTNGPALYTINPQVTEVLVSETHIKAAAPTPTPVPTPTPTPDPTPVPTPTPGTDIAAGLPPVTTTAKPMPAVPKPAKGVPFIDPVSGAKIIRITDIATEGAGSKVIKPAYSTVPAWNADESLLILYVQGGGHVLYNGKTYAAIKKLDIAPADIEHFYWDSKDPDILYYPWAYEASGVSKREIVKYHVSTGLKETLYAIPDSAAPGAYRVDFGGDPVYGDWANKVFGLRRRGSSDTGFIWSQSAGESPRVAGDCPQVSPSGTLYIQNGNLYDLSSTKLRAMKLNTTEHGDMTKLANGQDVWCSVQFDGPQGSGQLITENLQTGAITKVIADTNGYGYPKAGTHISGHAFKAPGWIAMSITGEITGKSLLSQSLLLVDLNTGKAFYAGQHHTAGSDGPNGYWAEPHVNISPSGTRMMFGSDWGGGPTVDTYIVELPSYR